jgi:hypothetical protein
MMQQCSNSGQKCCNNDDDDGPVDNDQEPIQPPPTVEESGANGTDYYWQRVGSVLERSTMKQENQPDDSGTAKEEGGGQPGREEQHYRNRMALFEWPVDSVTAEEERGGEPGREEQDGDQYYQNNEAYDEQDYEGYYNDYDAYGYYDDDGEEYNTKTNVDGLFFRTKPYSNISTTGYHCDCTICLQEFTANDTVGDLPCDHLFHKECLQTWLSRQNRCPLCQQQNIAKELGEMPCSDGSDVAALNNHDDNGPASDGLDVAAVVDLDDNRSASDSFTFDWSSMRLADALMMSFHEEPISY